jgi:hypothetical protein
MVTTTGDYSTCWIIQRTTMVTTTGDYMLDNPEDYYGKYYR